MDYALFIITFASLCYTPGVCMSLTLSLGASLGFRASLPFMCGALFGLLSVIVVCGYGASLVSRFPTAFYALQLFGIAFLFYTAFMLFSKKARFKDAKLSQKDRFALLAQGFLTNISNPQAWVVMIALLPQFLQKANLTTLATIILCLETCALCTYSLGGSMLRLFLQNHIDKLAKFSAICVFVLGIYMLWGIVGQISANL